MSFRGPLFGKQVTGQEPLFAVSYNKPALGWFRGHLFTSGRNTQPQNAILNNIHYSAKQLDPIDSTKKATETGRKKRAKKSKKSKPRK